MRSTRSIGCNLFFNIQQHREYVKQATGMEEWELKVNKMISVIDDLHIRHAALKIA